MSSKNIIRRPRAARLDVRAPRFSPEHHQALAHFRHDCLEQRSAEVIAAGEALGLSAMQTIDLNAEQASFLRGLVNGMGAPGHCALAACRTRGLCTDEKIACYWRNREFVRASFPQVDDALLRLSEQKRRSGIKAHHGAS